MIKQLYKNITICTLALSTTFTVLPATSYAKLILKLKLFLRRILMVILKCIHVQLQQVIVKNITQSLQFNFLTEPNYDKETVFIKAKGTIGSGLRILDPNGYWNSTLRWPGSYSVSIQNVDDNNNTNVTDFAPKIRMNQEKLNIRMVIKQVEIFRLIVEG